MRNTVLLSLLDLLVMQQSAMVSYASSRQKANGSTCDAESLYVMYCPVEDRSFVVLRTFPTAIFATSNCHSHISLSYPIFVSLPPPLQVNDSDGDILVALPKATTSPVVSRNL